MGILQDPQLGRMPHLDLLGHLLREHIESLRPFLDFEYPAEWPVRLVSLARRQKLLERQNTLEESSVLLLVGKLGLEGRLPRRASVSDI